MGIVVVTVIFPYFTVHYYFLTQLQLVLLYLQNIMQLPRFVVSGKCGSIGKPIQSTQGQYAAAHVVLLETDSG